MTPAHLFLSYYQLREAAKSFSFLVATKSGGGEGPTH